jgi:four helix bundle protein
MGHSYKQLLVWQKSKSFAVEIYKQTENFPRREIYGLTSQLRRAAVSVPSNIAEGQGRLTRGEFRTFLGQARGSLLEIATQLAISEELGYLSSQAFALLDTECNEIRRMLNALIESVRVTSVPVRQS